MAKNILIITGSPRICGNSNTLVKAFAGGAIAVGNMVKVFDTCHAKLEGCHADKSCEKSGCCGMKDDGVKLRELMCWADVLILASPIYWKGFTAQIKLAIDHFYQFAFPKGKAMLSIKETGLIATAMSPDEDIFNNMVDEYEHINELLGFKSRFKLLCSGLDGEDALSEYPDFIASAVRYGMEI